MADANVETAILEARRSLRDEGGRWKAGNLGAFKHGGRSQQVQQWVVEAPELAELTTAIAADLGGFDAISTLKRECIRAVAFKMLLRQRSVEPALAENGALTSKDRRRSAFETYLKLDDAIRRDMSLLGLERGEKDVTSLPGQTVVSFGGRGRAQDVEADS